MFLEAWRRRRSVQLHQGSALPWLYGVATNVLRNARRTLRRHAAALDRVPAAPLATSDEADEAAARIDDQRRMQQLLALFRRLPRREQEVLALIAWSELSYEEAARALGLPVGTVRSRVSRARRRLACLAGHDVAGRPTPEGALSP